MRNSPGNRLEGRPGDADAVRSLILAGDEVERFHDPAHPYLHPDDVDIALDLDRYDFAVTVNFEDGRPVARIETPAVAMPKSPTWHPLARGETLAVRGWLWIMPFARRQPQAP